MGNDIFSSMKNEDSTDGINKLLREIVEQMKTITEFSNSELKAISLCQSDKYLTILLGSYIVNKKHIKRKYSKELLKMLEHLSSITQIKGGM